MFLDKARRGRAAAGGSLCVGLDPHAARIPATYAATVAGMRSFLEGVIEATLRWTAVYKPNIAFYEQRGPEGTRVLREIVDRIHDAGRAVILDAKRGDIASTASAYAAAAFDVLDADAITVLPYMGEDAAVPFLDRGRFVFLVAAPSNPSASTIVNHGTPPLFQRVGELAAELERRYPGQVGLVVGATRIDAAQSLHRLAPELPWLVPGVGAQGGDLAQLAAAIDGAHEAWINVSRAVLFAKDVEGAAASWNRKIGVWGDG